MGKGIKKKSPDANEHSAENNQSDGTLTNQSEQHDSNTPLTLADMETFLKVMEEHIISKLSDQLTTDHATIAQHDQPIKHMETSLNYMETILA